MSVDSVWFLQVWDQSLIYYLVCESFKVLFNCQFFIDS